MCLATGKKGQALHYQSACSVLCNANAQQCYFITTRGTGLLKSFYYKHVIQHHCFKWNMIAITQHIRSAVYFYAKLEHSPANEIRATTAVSAPLEFYSKNEIAWVWLWK